MSNLSARLFKFKFVNFPRLQIKMLNKMLKYFESVLDGKLFHWLSLRYSRLYQPSEPMISFYDQIEEVDKL